MVAHGNADGGAVDIGPEAFLVLIQTNMANNAMPDAVYISTCGPGIAQFAAAVRLAAEQNQIWANTRAFGHNDPVAGPVPPPNDVAWVEF